MRSSATAEDLPEASFAGQYDTFLNVNSAKACVSAVKQCWASLWTERAYRYREKNGIDHQQIRMAVILQQQVDADMAGVAFSIDPVTGSRLRIVIEACQGLGEALVSGQVTPERWIWSKPKLVVLGKDPVEGTNLNQRVAKRLVRQVRRLERLLDAPLDVEWAVQDGKLYFLQARPITTLPAHKSWEDKQVWTNLNLGEVVPDVTTPLTYSVFKNLFTPLFRSLFGLAAADLRRAPIMGRVAGRLYFNLNTLFAAGRPFWMVLGRSPDTEEQLVCAMGGHQGDLDIPEDHLPDLGFSWLKFLLVTPRNLWRLFKFRPSRAKVFAEDFIRCNRALRQLDTTSMPIADLVQTLVRTMEQDIAQWDLMILTGHSPALPVLEWINHRWLGQKDFTLIYRLFGAQGNMADTEAGLDLWRLAMQAREVPDTEKAILSERDWATIESTFHPSFVQAWQAFMDEHGHHCRGELEFSNARWAERPDYILQMVRNYLYSLDRVDPLARHDQLRAQGEQLVDECRRRLGNPVKRWIFNWALKHARLLASDRENWKNQAVFWIATLRRHLLVLAQRLQARGILSESDDIFFLTLNELTPVAQDTAGFDVGERIAQRRAEYEWNCAQNPAPVVVGRFDPDKHSARPVAEDVTEFHGVAASPGIVTGRARVILLADDHATVASGEILVAPFTDPAWTPYFVPAAGVVMDLGGMLSHGSIIAREYGLPAVVNVGCATQVIKSGQMLEVDGTRGVVRVVEE